MKVGLVVALMLALDGGAPAVKANGGRSGSQAVGGFVRGVDAGVAMNDAGFTDSRLASENRDARADQLPGGVIRNLYS